MESLLGILLANVLVEFLEQQVFDKIHKPYCYMHYTDDIFACFPSHGIKIFSLFE